MFLPVFFLLYEGLSFFLWRLGWVGEAGRSCKTRPRNFMLDAHVGCTMSPNLNPRNKCVFHARTHLWYNSICRKQQTTQQVGYSVSRLVVCDRRSYFCPVPGLSKREESVSVWMCGSRVWWMLDVVSRNTGGARTFRFSVVIN